MVEKCSSGVCSGSSENEISQQTVESHSIKNFKEPEPDVSKISIVRPFSIETKNCTDIPSVLEENTAYGSETSVSCAALPSGLQESIQDKGMTEDTMGVMLEEASVEADLKADNYPEPVTYRSKLRKPKPVSLRKKVIACELSESEVALEHTSLASFSAEVDGKAKPLLEGFGIQNSYSDLQEISKVPGSDSGPELQEESRSSPLKLEFDFAEDGENVESRKALPKKLGRKLGSKQTPKFQQDAASKPAGTRGTEQPPVPTTDESPLSPAGSKPDPSLWDVPAGGTLAAESTLQNSPPLSSKGSYHFDPDNFESVDPFKPATAFPSSDFCSPPANHINEILESPKKAKSRLIT